MLSLALLSIATPSLAAPPWINHQGYLTDEFGDAIDGTVDIEFTLYDAELEGNNLWTESHLGLAVSARGIQRSARDEHSAALQRL